MKQFRSNSQLSGSSLPDLFDFCSDFRSLITLFPPQVVCSECSADECTFSIPGMALFKMQITLRDPVGTVKAEPVKAPFQFQLEMMLSKDSGSEGTQCCTLLTADLSIMQLMLVSRPLQYLVEHINSQLASR
jgi:hypothetical protein